MDNTSEGKQSDQNVVQMNEKSVVESQPMTDQSQTPSTSSNPSSASNSWWNSWVQKSTDTFESIKRDLNEFKETVSKEGAGVVSNTASYVSQTMRDTITGISSTIVVDYEEDEAQPSAQPSAQPQQTGQHNEGNECTGSNPETDKDQLRDEEVASDGHSSEDWAMNLTKRAKHKFTELMGNIADALVMNRNYYEDEDQMYVFSGDKLVAIDRWQQLLAEVQNDPQTYCHEPSGPPEHYESWLMTFNLIDYQKQMDHLLQSVPQMKHFYTQLVPNSLSDVDFWHRFYYRVHQLRECERKKIADKESNESKDLSEESTETKDNKKSVEIRLLDQNCSAFESKQMKRELLSIETNDCPDIQPVNDMTSTPDSSDTQKSETGSDDWEKTDIVVSDDDIKDWVKYE